jgi:ABC-type long-subunit fatty acid transport system fused permease/ATPase subunit
MDDSENYKALFEDLGWEHLQQFNVFGGQWHYFRKECEYGAQEELFTDNESKIDLLTGIRRTYTAIGLAALFINAINIANIVNLFQHGDKVFVLIILLILSVIIGLYAKVLTSITAKINKLKGKANPLS